MTKKIGIGVMGCAKIASRSFIPAIKSLEGTFNLLAVASRNPAKADSFSRQFDCKPYYSYESMLEDPSIDAVYMPLPTGLHKEWVIKTLEAGKHIYVEKSIARNHSEADLMVTYARSKNLSLMEGYMFQYHPQHDIVFGLLKENRIGEIRSFYTAFGFPPLPDDDFRYNNEIGGGALMDVAGYTVRAVHFLLGNHMQVTAASLSHDKKRATNIFGNAFLSGKDGLGAHIAFGFDQFYQNRYEIWGTKGKLLVERAFTPKPDFPPLIILETQNERQEIIAPADNHFVNALLEFYTVIQQPDKREKHFNDILLQSHSLEMISLLSTK